MLNIYNVQILNSKGKFSTPYIFSH